MKNISSLLFLTLASVFCMAQKGDWVWIHGSNTYDNLGNFGVQGVPSQSNEPPGLYEVCEWKDLNGKFWFYGGLDDNTGVNIHNDLWKFDPVDSEWTWVSGTHTYKDHGSYGVQGVASPSNRPPGLGYGVCTWVDLSGNLWMFGGWNDSTYADLWEYTISSNEWTWMKGPGVGNPTSTYGTQGVPDINNNPPARSECAASWVDANGDLWMFGGYIAQLFNDLWRYNIATNTWTWMKGSNLLTQKGFWGTMGVEDPANEPSARRAYCHWKDNAGNFWMFGGDGLDSSGTSWQLSDLWRYNPATNNWTWMNGQNVGSPTNVGVFGTKCTTASINQPPPRFENRACWTDPNGNFWMWGGQFMTSPFSTETENDLWKYCVSANQWTWEGGDNSFNTAANWGTEHVPSPANKPDGRTGSVGWIDNAWNLYLFGGSAGGFGSMYNDLWRFAIDTTCGSTCPSVVQILPVPAFTANNSFCAGNCTDFTDLSTNNPTSWQWTFTGAIPSSSTDQNPQSICYINPGSYDVTLTVHNSSGSNTITISNYINANPSPPVPSITCSNDTLYCSIDTSYRTYQWYDSTTLIVGAITPSHYISQNGNYNVAVTNVYGCTIAVGISTTGCLTTGITNLSNNHDLFVYPNPAKDNVLITGYSLSGKNTITIYNVLGETLYKEELNDKQELINCKRFPSGVYLFLITNEEDRWVGRFVKD